MSSVHPRPDGTYFQCSLFTPKAGGGKKRITHSLGSATERRAMKIGQAAQDLADALDPQQRRDQKVLMRMVEHIFDVAGVPPPWEVIGSQKPFSKFAGEWLERRKRQGESDRLKLIARVIDEFSRYVGNRPISKITGQDMQDWYDSEIRAGLAPGSVENKAIILAAIFKHAIALGAIIGNPVALLEKSQGGSVLNREAMPDALFDKVLAYAIKEKKESWWHAMMIARFAGLRLMDAIRLCKSNVTFPNAEKYAVLSYKAAKTGRLESVPVFEPLLSALKSWNLGGDQYCPDLVGQTATRNSDAFGSLVEAAGVENPEKELPSGRKYRQWTFHSLRHAFITDLAKKGIPEELRMLLVGHKSKAVHAGYDHSTATDTAARVAKYFGA